MTNVISLRPSAFRVGVIVLIAVGLAAKGHAALTLPILGDEPDDIAILAADLQSLPQFFSGGHTAGYTQSRLPFLVSAPWLIAKGMQGIPALRLLFLALHAAYLLASFRLATKLLGQAAGWVYLLLLGTSCYLAGFAVFSMTTSDGLYLLLHVLTLSAFCKRYWAHTDANTGDGTAFGGFWGFCLIAGLCVASKLFGVLLLLALAGFHVLSRPTGFVRVSTSLLEVCAVNSAFAVAVVLLNISTIPDVLRTGLALMLSSALVLGAVWLAATESHRSASTIAVRTPLLWLMIAWTSFNLTLALSPVYLNLRNLLHIVSWFPEWNSGALVARSNVWDMVVVLAIKFGWLPLIALVAALAIAVKERGRELVARHSPAMLICVVFLVHLAAISASRHHVTWYPIAIFPLLLLPLAWLARQARRRALPAWFAVASVILTVGDNLRRYAMWYPYAHLDGAQFGPEHVGWNRAGFLSFEAVPHLRRWLAARTHETETASVGFNASEVPRYDRWAATFVQASLRSAGIRRISVTPSESLSGNDYYVTSPYYHPAAQAAAAAAVEAGEAQLEERILVKGLHVMSVWSHRSRRSGRQPEP